MDKGQADGISCRSMEMFQAFGFAPTVLDQGYWVNEATFWKADPADPARLGAPPRPVRILHGEADDRVPLEVSTSYLEEVGGDTALGMLPGVDHFALIDPTSAAFTRCGEVIDALSPRLGSCP